LQPETQPICSFSATGQFEYAYPDAQKIADALADARLATFRL
jgi:hypothetical protein